MKITLTDEEVKEALREYIVEKTGIRTKDILFRDVYNSLITLNQVEAYQEPKNEQQSRTTAQSDLPDKPF